MCKYSARLPNQNTASCIFSSLKLKSFIIKAGVYNKKKPFFALWPSSLIQGHHSNGNRYKNISVNSERISPSDGLEISCASSSLAQ